jgi:hypothetical protein
MQTKGRYVFGTDWALLFGIQNSEATSQTGVFKRTNNSLNQILAGFQYYFPLSRVELIPEVLFINSLDTPDTNSDFVPNNEGVFELIARSRAQKSFGKYFLFGSGGVDYRGSGRSGLFLYGGGIEGRLGAWSLAAELDGFLTFIADRDKSKSNTSRDDRAAYQNRVAGGSKKFYSYDPSETNLVLSAAYPITRAIVLGGHVGTLLSGTNTASGFFFGLDFNLTFGLPGAPSDTSPLRERRLRSRSTSRKQRRPVPSQSGTMPAESRNERVYQPPFNESIDESFDEAADSPFEPSVNESETLEKFQGEEESKIDQSQFQDSGRELRKKRSRPIPQQRSRVRQKSRTELPVFQEETSLQQQLDDAEMKIELKHRKSKSKPTE